MPIFKAGQKLIYYAHVPKCGGSAVEQYLADRFGAVAFQNTDFLALPQNQRWSKTSPQHIDVCSLDRLFPPSFFDATFAIVRHPVSRLISAYHFQIDVEKRIPATTTFSEWLQDLPEIMAENPFAFDNHVRPMSEIVPEGAYVFHLEHGLDSMVPWLDMVTGEKTGMRAVPHVNKKGEYAKGNLEKVEPTDSDRALVAKLYAIDFNRFSYDPNQKEPLAPPPSLSAEVMAERDIALKTMASPMNQLKSKLRKVLGH